MHVINCERKTGVYNDINYDNLYFMCDTGDNDKMLFGTRIVKIKVSVKDFNKYYPGGPEAIKGKNVIFAFDQNARLIGIYDVK